MNSKDGIKTIFEKSNDCPLAHDRIGGNGENAIKDFPISELIPEEYLEPEHGYGCDDEIILPEISEVELVRHYVKLSQNNYGVDNGFYPLGSCTMKYNPKINEFTANLEGFTNLHPLQPECQGALELMYNLENQLSEIAGMDAFTLQPAAGAHGEFTGISLIKKYFESREESKKYIIVPDSAHGTNPASSAMCGYGVIVIKSNEKGEVSLEELEFAMKNGDVAGIMLTNPNTVGLFESNILKITEIVHKYGGLCYYDGANMNALLGKCRPGDMGFDVIHFNLHKTFSTPHGGGGPGSGPVGVKSILKEFLPYPRILQNGNKFEIKSKNGSSIGSMKGFYGNFGVLVRAYTYITMLGKNGLKRASENAVLNANYLRVKLNEIYEVPYSGICKHEVVFSDKNMPNHVTTMDIAKRLLDYGIHAPTIYFPLIVHGAMMCEPTETESKDRLDQFVDVMKKIYKESEEDPEMLKTAPHSTPIGRLDDVQAARSPILKFKCNIC